MISMAKFRRVADDDEMMECGKLTSCIVLYNNARTILYISVFVQ